MPLPPAKKQKACIREIQVHKLWTKVYSQKGLTAMRIEHSVCPAYLLERTPGMQCPLASSLGTNIFSASLLLALVLAQFKFATKWLTRKVSCNLATMSMILAACDLNEHGLWRKAPSASDIISAYTCLNDFEIQ